MLIWPFGLLDPKDLLIMWLFNHFTMKIPDEGYSKNVLCALNKISTFSTETESKHWHEKK